MISKIYNQERIKNGILKEKINKEIFTKNYIIKSRKDNEYTYLCFSDKPNLIIIDDSIFTITLYFSKLYNRNFKKILIGGLGLGVLPFICQDFCERVCVIEKDIDLINAFTQINLFKSNVELLHSDVFQYETDEKFDVICLDIWNNDSYENLSLDIDILKNKFHKNINKDFGIIYFPIKNLVF